jgi:chemotaxis signal transduction protein
MTQEASPSARAWLLDWPLQTLALAPCEVIELLDEPEVHPVPMGPAWCRALLYWRGRLLPLAQPAGIPNAKLYVVVVAYERPDATLDYVALALTSQPRQIQVHDGNDCEPPARCALAANALRACFNHENQVVVVPELSVMFGGVAA